MVGRRENIKAPALGVTIMRDYGRICAVIEMTRERDRVVNQNIASNKPSIHRNQAPYDMQIP
jgi:hypothetical protein